METGARDTLKQAIASADSFALLSAAFSWPESAFAEALLNGSFDEDWQACLNELGVPVDESISLLRELNDAPLIEATETAEALLSSLRKEYSRLFLMLGKYACIFPYEAAFRHVAAGREGLPALFIAPATKEVEEQMRSLGALPDTAQQEPVDSLWGEMDFLRFLYTSWAQALHQGDEPSAHHWETTITDFRVAHTDAWIPELMERVQKETRHPVYRALAKAAVHAFDITVRVVTTTLLPQGVE